MDPGPFHLLLVEDEPADAALFEDLLAEQDQQIVIHHVENGQEALNFLLGPARGPRPHLVVLDLNMPVMDGHEFLQQVKASPEVRGLPVLVLSTSEHPDDIARAYDEQASGYVVKPGSYREYTQVLEIVRAYWRGLVRLPTLDVLSLSRPRR